MALRKTTYSRTGVQFGVPHYKPPTKSGIDHAKNRFLANANVREAQELSQRQALEIAEKARLVGQ